MSYEVIRIDEQSWRIEDGGVRFFLLTGDSAALLVDSGMSVPNVRELAASLTDLPLRLLNTHADVDHVSGNGAFEEFYLHPSDAALYYRWHEPRTGRIVPVWDGDVIDLGSRELEVIHLPGHTPGSIALLDRSRRVLISGDPFQDGDIFMFGPHREMHAYILSTEKAMRRAGEFDAIWPSHGSFPLSPALLPQLRDAAERILRRELPGREQEMFGMRHLRYDAGVARFLCDQ